MSDVRSVITVIVMIFALAIGILIMLKVTDSMVTGMQNSDMVDYKYVNETLNSANTLQQGKSDTIFLGFFIALVLGLIITGYFATAYPIFVIFYIIALIVLGVISALLTYLWESISQSTTFLPYLSDIPVTNFIMSNLVMFMSVIGFITLIVMYIGYTKKMSRGGM